MPATDRPKRATSRKAVVDSDSDAPESPPKKPQQRTRRQVPEASPEAQEAQSTAKEAAPDVPPVPEAEQAAAPPTDAARQAADAVKAKWDLMTAVLRVVTSPKKLTAKERLKFPEGWHAVFGFGNGMYWSVERLRRTHWVLKRHLHPDFWRAKDSTATPFEMVDWEGGFKAYMNVYLELLKFYDHAEWAKQTGAHKEQVHS